MATLNLYDKDFFAWTQEQAKLIRDKAFDKLDLVNLVEEIECMGKHEKRELSSRLEILLMHLLKWKYQGEEQSKSWLRTIREQRHQIKKVLKDNPSLKPLLQEYTLDVYSYSRISAHDETGVFLKNFPEVCEWSIEQILDDEFLPN
ncbi:MAG: DUF29 domain-containing protein [Burkholderiales bacterium]|nr:DUF29 domain-containing protein [Burkholderiales bacterium]